MLFRRLLAGKGLLISLIVVFVAVESIVAACFLSLVHFKNSTNWMAQSQHVLLELERLVGNIVEAETHQRAYLLTGSEEYLPSYRDAIDTFDHHIRQIGGLTRRDRRQQDRVAYLATQIEQRSDEMDQVIVTRRTKGLPHAKSLVVANQLNGTMSAIEDITGQIREEETRLLERHKAESDVWAFTTGSFAAVFFLLTAILFVLCGIIMKMALASQEQAERILKIQQQSSPSAPLAG
jgi:CHASE3 domain sensor protein